MARAPVSKTGGCGFETCHPCQRRAAVFDSDWSSIGVAFHPARFVREVRSEISRVTWPTRKETAVTTGLVFLMVALISVFFFVVDQAIGVAVRALLGIGA